jgi:iron complex outermembrane receptor protein
MKVEHKTIKELQQKDSNLNRRVSYNPVSSFYTIETSIRGLSGNRVLVYSQGVRMENQQFDDEHGLGLNDGVESVIKGPFFIIWFRCAGVLYFNPEKFANANL